MLNFHSIFLNAANSCVSLQLKAGPLSERKIRLHPHLEIYLLQLFTKQPVLVSFTKSNIILLDVANVWELIVDMFMW